MIDYDQIPHREDRPCALGKAVIQLAAGSQQVGIAQAHHVQADLEGFGIALRLAHFHSTAQLHLFLAADHAAVDFLNIIKVPCGKALHFLVVVSFGVQVGHPAAPGVGEIQLVHKNGVDVSGGSAAPKRDCAGILLVVPGADAACDIAADAQILSERGGGIQHAAVDRVVHEESQRLSLQILKTDQCDRVVDRRFRNRSHGKLPVNDAVLLIFVALFSVYIDVALPLAHAHSGRHHAGHSFLCRLHQHRLYNFFVTVGGLLHLHRLIQEVIGPLVDAIARDRSSMRMDGGQENVVDRHAGRFLQRFQILSGTGNLVQIEGDQQLFVIAAFQRDHAHIQIVQHSAEMPVHQTPEIG